MIHTLSRSVARAAPRRVTRSTRGLAAHAGQSEQLVTEGNPRKEWIEYKKNLEHHAAETTELWRKISFYVAVPATLLGSFWVYRVESEHAAHTEHIKAEHGGEVPPVPDYDYLNVRRKPFPWGMNSLFFNPHTNKDVTAGAEDSDSD